MAQRTTAPTIRDIAREAGVSHVTVSRVFDGKSAVAAVTKARVLEVAARLGYRPNDLARGLARVKRSREGKTLPPG